MRRTCRDSGYVATGSEPAGPSALRRGYRRQSQYQHAYEPEHQPRSHHSLRCALFI
jgi:hypothetical protein